MKDEEFGQAIHRLLKELGWTHGALTPSLVHQALAQVRHLKKAAENLDRVQREKAEAISDLITAHREVARHKAEIVRLDGELAQARRDLCKAAEALEHANG